MPDGGHPACLPTCLLGLCYYHHKMAHPLLKKLEVRSCIRFIFYVVFYALYYYIILPGREEVSVLPEGRG